MSGFYTKLYSVINIRIITSVIILKQKQLSVLSFCKLTFKFNLEQRKQHWCELQFRLLQVGYKTHLCKLFVYFGYHESYITSSIRVMPAKRSFMESRKQMRR